MKTQILTFILLLATLSFTSCKNNKTQASETAVPMEAPAPREQTMQTTETRSKDSVKANEKDNDKNEKE